MEGVTLKIDEPSREWVVYRDDLFIVTVKAWKKWDGWGWNVYAHIFEGHPLNLDVDSALALPFHWGPTYEKRITTAPAQGIRFDFEKVYNVLKIGSDYQHHGDDYENDHPDKGIPWRVEEDAAELVHALIVTKAVQAV